MILSYNDDSIFFATRGVTVPYKVTFKSKNGKNRGLYFNTVLSYNRRARYDIILAFSVPEDNPD